MPSRPGWSQPVPSRTRMELDRRRLVPRLNADLARDVALAQLEYGGAKYVGAIGVAAGLGERAPVVIEDRVLNAVAHVTCADILNPRADLFLAA